ncbi:MAG: hypothetical protein LBD22_02100 [Spirochaetaceae bacterium]|jgi:hypothetical protein|nr:hypothetical protein [Spirochaetaceae bacterium]
MGLHEQIDELRDILRVLSARSKRQLTEFFAQKHIRRIVTGISVLTALTVLLTIFVTILSTQKKKKPAVDVFQAEKITTEDLFLPSEPDFLPEVLLEQKKKDTWTAEDADPFWTDPAELGEKVWLEKVNTILDKLLERVP